jgi:site-specific DNA recombinase
MSASARAPRVALYSRVSSEEQAERETIEAQRTFLKNYARLHSLNVVREFSEDAPGSLPLDKRSEGRRLLADAQARRFDIVVVHRVDRLGRTLQTILEAHETLATAGVAIKSATEPFDTSNPVGSSCSSF